jgi:flavodoxin
MKAIKTNFFPHTMFLSAFIIMGVIMGGCTAVAGASDSDSTISSQTQPTDSLPETGSGKKTLVAYFSRTGNTEKVAKIIHELVGGDLFEIVPSEAYPEDYQQCLTVAQQELDADYRPKLLANVADIAAYDTVFIGFPIWYGDSPMLIRSFIDENDLSGKTVAVFATSGTSGINTALESIRKLCPNSSVVQGLLITSRRMNNAEELVTNWLNHLNVNTTRVE